MIENFLLDPDSIWEALQSVIERTALRTVDDVSNALDVTFKVSVLFIHLICK